MEDSKENSMVDSSMEIQKSLESKDNLERQETELTKEYENKHVPKFIKNTVDELVGNERGSAYHRIFECLDYSKVETLEDIKDNIHKMLMDEKITKQQYDCIKPEDIYKFTKSEVGKLAARASSLGKLRREQPFVFDVDGQLVQGIIDMFIIEDDGITIVDYKTDRVRFGKVGIDELKKRYKIQLDYYGKAVEQITGIKVKKKIIYAVNMGREIEV